MTKISDDAASLVSIGQLAKEAGVSSRTIRYYEELGILPEPRRSPGGTRKYPQEYGGYIAAALALKDLGFRLEEVKPLARLAAGRSVSPGQRDAAARLVEDKIEALARQVTMLRRLHESVSIPGQRAARISRPWHRSARRRRGRTRRTRPSRPGRRALAASQRRRLNPAAEPGRRTREREAYR